MSGWAHRGYSIRAEPTPMPPTPEDQERDRLVLEQLRQHREEAANRVGHKPCTDWRCLDCTRARRRGQR